jgi:signal transduction histidine kinase
VRGWGEQDQLDRVRYVSSPVLILLLLTIGEVDVTRWVIAGLIAVHLVLSIVLEMVARRRPLPLRAIDAFLNLGMLFALGFAEHDLRAVSLMLYVMMVVRIAALLPRPGVAITVGLTAILAVARELTVPVEERYSPALMLSYLATVPMVAGLVASRREAIERTGERLQRVQTALLDVTTVPGLDETLDSIVASAANATAAHAAGVNLVRDGRLVLAGLYAPTQQWPKAAVPRHAPVGLEARAASPLALARDENRTVVVPDITAEDRFPRWSAVLAPQLVRYGVCAQISVPIRHDGQVVGVMEAVYQRRIDETSPEVAILQAYAEPAVHLILRAQAYETARALADQLAAADRLKDEILALVSHELRSPIAAVQGFIETVLLQWDRLDDGARQRLLARASARAGDLDLLVTRLLLLSRIESGRLELRKDPAVLGAAIADFVEALDPVLCDHELVVAIPDDLDVVVDLDALRHIVENLLTNAAKYAPAGTTITVSAVREGDEVVLRVADEGPGIPAAERERVFDRFHQVVREHETPSGAGLGLAIVRRAAVAMGGRAWVDAGCERGAVVAVALPVVDRAGLTRGEPPTTLDRPV